MQSFTATLCGAPRSCASAGVVAVGAAGVAASAAGFDAGVGSGRRVSSAAFSCASPRSRPAARCRLPVGFLSFDVSLAMCGSRSARRRDVLGHFGDQSLDFRAGFLQPLQVSVVVMDRGAEGERLTVNLSLRDLAVQQMLPY